MKKEYIVLTISFKFAWKLQFYAITPFCNKWWLRFNRRSLIYAIVCITLLICVATFRFYLNQENRK